MSKKAQQDNQEKLGTFIKLLRQRNGLTQAGLAKALHTSQSAVARMESGNQNFTMLELNKISEVLNHKIIGLQDSIDFKITGGKKLSGTIATNSSKNGGLHLMFAALINKGTTTLRNAPKIEEIARVIEVFESIGVSVRWENERDLVITPPKKFKLKSMNIVSAKRIRSILMSIGSLIHETDSFTLPFSGGCKMGERTIAAHQYGFEKLGVSIATKSDAYEITHKKLSPAEIVLYEASDTATTNLLIGAAGLAGVTTLRFATSNYMVQDVCFFLEKLGVQIDGIGTSTLVVHGVGGTINKDVEVFVSEDPIESMMFISAAVVTNSKLTITRCPIDFLALELLKLEKMGLVFKTSPVYLALNGRTRLVDITVHPSTLKALDDKIHALPYPGINIDNLPFFVPIATQAEGQTLIHDWMWENRAIYFTELNRLGAQLTLADPHRVFVHGKSKLKAAQMVCPPALRPAVIVMIAMLAAEGTSVLRNVYSIKRGYEEIAERLNGIGADIEILRGM
jgi:UDP-N-acetylglucosamine 1-carboxyvinyltransferase